MEVDRCANFWKGYGGYNFFGIGECPNNIELLLCIFTSLLVLQPRKSWSKYFFGAVFNLFCSFQMFFSDLSPEIKYKEHNGYSSSYSRNNGKWLQNRKISKILVCALKPSICAKGAQCYLCTTSAYLSRWGWLNNTGWVWFITFNVLSIYKFVTTNTFNCHDTKAVMLLPCSGELYLSKNV